LVAVNTEDEMMIDRAVNIFERHNAIDIDRRVEEWRKSGWTGYDPNAKMLSKETPVHQAAPKVAPKTAPVSTSASTAMQPGRTAQASTTTRQAVKTTAIQLSRKNCKLESERFRGHGASLQSYGGKPVQEQVQLREEHVR
jgi:hypothetical protein